MRLLFVGQPKPSEIYPICDDQGFVVHATIGDAIAILRQDIFDLIILDVGSLSESAWHFIRAVRTMPNDTPLLALTGRQADHRARALRLGADDTITKPVGADHLRARIAAFSRRRTHMNKTLLRVGSLTLLLVTREVWFRDLAVRVSGKEYLVLELLALRQDRFVTREMFLDHVYGGMNEPEPRIIDVFLCQLRRKLGFAGGAGMIRSEPGQGYLIRATDDDLARPPAARPGEAWAAHQN